MALTIADLGEQSSDLFDRGVLKRFAETSALSQVMPWKKISGDTYKYRVQESLSGVEWRRVNQAYAESTGRIGARSEDIGIIGGEFFIDRALKRFSRTGGDSYDLVAEQATLKGMALARELERAVFEGDKLVDPDELQGLRPRLTGSQVILAGAGGATLTIAMLDTLLDTVAHSAGRVHLFMPKPVRRKITDLVNATGGSVRINYTDIDKVGKQISAYDGFPIHVVEDGWDTTTILGAEDPGDGTADTYSIYALAFSEDMGIHGLINGDGPMVDAYQVAKETETGPPGEKWRMEMYPGMAMRHTRAGARLRAILV